MTIKTAKVGLMLDVETLGKSSRAVVWQSALMGWDLLDPDTILEHAHHQYLPIQPQLDFMGDYRRTVDASTLLYWMKPDMGDARDGIEYCDSEDINELASLMRHFLRSFDRMTDGGTLDYELWTRGQFDVPIMESLLRGCGLEAPWHFRTVRDLRTLEAVSGVSYKEVPQPLGFIKHRADWDCRFQIAHHTACMRALAGA